MQFKNPLVLYSLFALLIPIIIHLFKLRKFQKTPFTNVAFLEKIKLQTRKSSQLKKWLVLLSRLLLFTGIIFAFAEPYFPSKTNKTKPELIAIYLDNSFSMEAKGTNGPLLKRAIQELLETIEENQLVSIFTNNEVYKNVLFSEIKNEIIDINYGEDQLTPKQLQLKFNQLTKNHPNNLCVAISDFQEKKYFNFKELKTENLNIIQLNPQTVKNVSIDSLWVSKKSNELKLHIEASASNYTDNTSLSVKNGANLIGKASLNFKENKNQSIEIPLPLNKEINGDVQITDNGLFYDNKRFFSINIPKKTKVLAISETNDNFLKRIFTPTEFDFLSYNLNNLNYAELSEVNTIILNEVEKIPEPLIEVLKNAHNNGNIICIIPANKTNNKYETLLKPFGLEFKAVSKTEKKVTTISFDHPIYKDVFTKKIDNFQYPTVKESFNLLNGNALLSLEDNTPFLAEKNNVFVFAAPLNKEITNFKQSPLIVPTFYNIAKQNSTTPKIEYRIGNSNEIKVETTQENQEDVLQIKGENEQFIPLQQIHKNYVQIQTNELPKNSGNFKITTKNKDLQSVSFNYGNSESLLKYANFEIENKPESVSSFFKQVKAGFEITELWKWFLIFALVFLLIEILLLKFLK